MPRRRTQGEPPSNNARLLAYLDRNPERAQEIYLLLYQRLRRFFEYRGCHHPEEAADETLDRVNYKLEQGVIVPNIDAFIMGIARLVRLEFIRAQGRFVPLPDEFQLPSAEMTDEDDGALACLERCARKLPPESETLIRRYHDSRRSEDRASLAVALGVNLNVLRLRASRIRDKLENCILICLGRDRRV
jgi:DNA-directed RNA polymerase specialized sigma24 family protein